MKLRRTDYQVAWICPVSDLELLPSRLMLDEEYDVPDYDTAYDDNVYTCGVMAGHNVVLATCPPGMTGNVNATRVAGPMFKTFPNIRMAVLVGIGGGVPSRRPANDTMKDVHLGDVVVGWPGDGGPACIYYELGKLRGDDSFEILGTVDKPDRVLLNALGKLESDHELDRNTFAEHRKRISVSKHKQRFSFPGYEKDRLYQSTYRHVDHSKDRCDSCDVGKLVNRATRTENTAELVFHRGRIASGNTVVKHGEHRDKISDLCRGALCIEMEAAGVDAGRSCLVIRGISDYADSHKNDIWRPYAAANAAIFARELLGKVPPAKVEKVERMCGIDPSAIIPFGRDKDFIQRGDTLDCIHRACAAPDSRIALVGLGGVGKSQIAIEFAYQVREKSPETWVFWIHASNAARCEQSFREIADHVNIPERRDRESNIFQLVRDWLRRETKRSWILVIDNIDDASLLFHDPTTSKNGQANSHSNPIPILTYLPHCQNGFILFTTRSRQAALQLVEPSDIITIEPMIESEALALIGKKLASQVDNDSATALAIALEYMPLAIVQATAYISRMMPHSVRQYVDKYQHSDRGKFTLLDHEGGQLRRDHEAKNSIIITWQISFNHIRQLRPSAANLLALMSYFDRQSIPDYLLRVPGDKTKVGKDEDKSPSSDLSDYMDNEWNSCQSEFSDGDAFEEDIAVLRDYSFISVTADERRFQMHRLVQIATQKWLEIDGQQEKWIQQFVSILSTHLPSGSYENWTTWESLLPHAKAAGAQRLHDEAALVDWASILHKTAWYYETKRHAHEAEKTSIRAMKVRKKFLGEDHVDTMQSTTIVGLAYMLQGRWEEAETIFVKVMELRKQKLGADHLDTVGNLNDLARVYWYQGRWEAAEKLFGEVIEIRKRKLGPEHPDTVDSIGNLASVYYRQDQMEAAERLYLEITEIRKRILGPDHPDTLSIMGNLAATYREQGRMDEVEKLQVEILEIAKNKMGPDHLFTVLSTSNLATTYFSRGQWSLAEKLFMTVIEIRKQKLGADHPSTLISMSNLATTLRNQHRWEESEKLQIEVLETRRKKEGMDHHATLNSMHNLAITMKALGRDQEAITMMKECAQLRERVLGTDHRDYLSSFEAMKEWEEDQRGRN